MAFLHFLAMLLGWLLICRAPQRAPGEAGVLVLPGEGGVRFGVVALPRGCDV